MTKPPDKMPLVLGLVISRPILYLVKVNSCHLSITYSTYTISIHHSVYPAFRQGSGTQSAGTLQAPPTMDFPPGTSSVLWLGGADYGDLGDLYVMLPCLVYKGVSE